MPTIYDTQHTRNTDAIRNAKRHLLAALVPRFAAHYRAWLSSVDPDSHVGQVPTLRFLGLSPETVGAAALWRALKSCAEHYPLPIPMHGVCVRVGMDVVETTDDTADYLEDLGAKLIEILIESSELLVAATEGSGRKTFRIHPAWAKRLLGAHKAGLHVIQ